VSNVQPLYATEAQLARLYNHVTPWLEEHGQIDLSECAIQGTYMGLPIVENCAPAIDFSLSYAAIARYAPGVVRAFSLSQTKNIELSFSQACYYQGSKSDTLHDDFVFDPPSAGFRFYGNEQSAYHMQSLRVCKESDWPMEEAAVSYSLSRNNDVRVASNLAAMEFVDSARPGEYGALLQTEYVALAAIAEALTAHSPEELQATS